MMMCAPTLIGSMQFCGMAPWPPLPFTVTENSLLEYIIVELSLYMNIPIGSFPGPT